MRRFNLTVGLIALALMFTFAANALAKPIITKDVAEAEKKVAWQKMKAAFKEATENKEKYQIGHLGRRLKEIKAELKKADRMMVRKQYAQAYDIYIWAQEEITKAMNHYQIRK